MKKINVGFTSLILAFFMFTGCVSTGGLTESQKIGAKNSPAALVTVLVSDRAEWIDLTESSYEKMNDGKKFMSATGQVKAAEIPEELINASATELKKGLEQVGGFTFVNEKVVSDALAEAKKKAEKKSGWNKAKKFLTGDVSGILSDVAVNAAGAGITKGLQAAGMKLFTVTTPTGYYEATPSNESLTKAVVKAAKKNKQKAKSLVYATVEYSIEQFPAENVPTKAYCLTTIYITDESGKLKKQVNGVVFSSPVNWNDFVADPSILISKFPMLMKESIEYVTSNLNVKTSLFAIPKLKVDTERLISDSSFGFHPSKKVFTDGGK